MVVQCEDEGVDEGIDEAKPELIESLLKALSDIMALIIDGRSHGCSRYIHIVGFVSAGPRSFLSFIIQADYYIIYEIPISPVLGPSGMHLWIPGTLGKF